VKKPTVYIETSIISFLTGRPSRDLSVWWYQQTTREWWETCRGNFHLYISQPVYSEIARGDVLASALRLEAIRGIELLRTTPEVENLAQELLDSHSIPAKAATDAFHIALAACHEMDFLLTWNCKHIANPFAERHFQRIITQNGYRYPVITTPVNFDTCEED
jgi:predicted nucleic acid-binding protein